MKPLRSHRPPSPGGVSRGSGSVTARPSRSSPDPSPTVGARAGRGVTFQRVLWCGGSIALGGGDDVAQLVALGGGGGELQPEAVAVSEQLGVIVHGVLDGEVPVAGRVGVAVLPAFRGAGAVTAAVRAVGVSCAVEGVAEAAAAKIGRAHV